MNYYRSIINIVVLLEEFQTSVDREKEDADRIVGSENVKRRIMGVLDPLSSRLFGYVCDQT